MNVVQLASKIGQSKDYVIDLLDELGICVLNESIDLTEAQMTRLLEYLRELKNSSNSKPNNQNSKPNYSRNRSAKPNDLEYYVKTHRIFIDTCSLNDPHSEKILDELSVLLKKHNRKLIIATKVIEELQKHQKQKKDMELAKKSNSMLKRLHSMMEEELIDIRGVDNDPFADNVFLYVFTRHRIKYKLLLITQDHGLSQDILNLNNAKSVKSQKTAVKRISKTGKLVDYYMDNNDASRQRGNNSYNTNDEIVDEYSQDEIIDKFNMADKITDIKDELIDVSLVPTEGEFVYSEKYGKIKLSKSLTSGGEGFIFETDGKYIAKIYKKDKLTTRRYEKLKLMITKEMNMDGICWPKDIIFNENKEFVGFIMDKARGKVPQVTIFNKNLLLKNFPDWKKRDCVELTITILEKIKYLHDRNIVLGDINPMNILIYSTKEVYFVDTDSYQIEGFPCPVGMVPFTAPEIQGNKNFSTFLRTIGNDNFALATLIFMILMPGKHPYAQQGGISQMDNIKNMDFSYRLKSSYNHKAPEGSWRYIWSHLSFSTKEALYKTFTKGEEYSTESARLSAAEWISNLNSYLYALDSGMMRKQDSMSEELFPTRFKRVKGVTYVECRLCKEEVDEEETKNGICKKCLNSGEEYECKICKQKMVFTNYLKYIKNAKRFEYCTECNDKLNEVYEKRTCVECGDTFEITNRLHRRYKENNYEMPKRCSKCIKIRKNNSNANSTSRPKNTNISMEDEIVNLFNS